MGQNYKFSGTLTFSDIIFGVAFALLTHSLPSSGWLPGGKGPGIAPPHPNGRRRAQREAGFHKRRGGKQLEPSWPLTVRKKERDSAVAKYFCYSPGTTKFQTSRVQSDDVQVIGWRGPKMFSSSCA